MKAHGNSHHSGILTLLYIFCYLHGRFKKPSQLVLSICKCAGCGVWPGPSRMWHLLLDDVVECGAYTPDEADWMRLLLEEHMIHFERPVVPRLLHMDVWSQNILIEESGRVTGLVDFDRALWGDVEIEFAVLDYCGISEAAFWQGYGRQRDTSPPAMVRRAFYLLYEVQKYMPIRIWRRDDPAGALRYKEQSFALARQISSM